jgi:N-methylhydantoinase B
MTGTPASALAMEGTIRHIIERVSSDGFEEGDAFCTNDPWLGAGQLHELTLPFSTYDIENAYTHILIKIID